MDEAYVLVRALVGDVEPEFWVVELQNGLYSYLAAKDLEDVEPGKLYLVSQGRDDRVFPAPAAMTWGSAFTAIGTVKHLLSDDRVILDINGMQRLTVANPDVPLEVGDLVTLDDSRGIGSRLSAGQDLKPQQSVHEVKLADLADDDAEFVGAAIIAEIERAVELPLRNSEAFRSMSIKPPKGVLFVGPSGTGKTLMARRIARRVEASFFVVNGPELSSRYVGDAEAELRELFERAESRERAIIFFDEIDSVAPSRSDRTHESDIRFVSMLLTLMDGMRELANVQVIGSTNRVDSVDPALRRGGRFHVEIYFPNPSFEDRLRILEQRCSRAASTQALDLALVAQQTDGWPAADVSALWDEAGWTAIEDGRREILMEDVQIAVERGTLRSSSRRAGANR
ncbi:AAA family ATPase [uncultured Microbacterium sp.]|uniref:ATP-binding protein n=1 Tax=uncultured Microbacterium sp. TaxID=191216 RepID=UPI00260B6F73|nr:AAA family ATPase [uncultured Microbacterium sp.]